MSKGFQKLRKFLMVILQIIDWNGKTELLEKNQGILLANAKNIRYIHVGYHRTGATFLQQEVFPKYKVSKKNNLVTMFFVVDFLTQVSPPLIMFINLILKQKS